MENYKVIGIDLAKRKFHLSAIDDSGNQIFKQALSREDFLQKTIKSFPAGSHFAMEACCGCHYVAQVLEDAGHKVTLLRPKDVKPYAKTRQKNDLNDALAICKAACDPELKKVMPKNKVQQEVAYMHKARQNAIQQRIQRSNALITSLLEFGYVVSCGKSQFVKDCRSFIEQAYEHNYITQEIYDQMILDAEEISALIGREKALEKIITQKNKTSQRAQLLETIPGIGPINASILSNKACESYESPKDFSASLGLVPKQYTTGGKIQLGSITKQGDRYARTMLIQGARSLVMRASKEGCPDNDLYRLIERLKRSGKKFNVICVAVANKLARIACACLMQGLPFRA